MAAHAHGFSHCPVLDIGGEVGAIVAYLPAMPAGKELDIRPAGDDAGRFHTGVHLRLVQGVTLPVAVFPEVVAGRYELLDEQLAPIRALDVTGAEVTVVDLRSSF
jgi:hypothetical protein